MEKKRNLQLIIIYDRVLRIDILINTAHKIKIRHITGNYIHFFFFHKKSKRIQQEASKIRLYFHMHSSKSTIKAHIKMH